jgi:hypothetical protein
MKLIAPVLLSVLVLLTSSAVADNTLAKFRGGIGVIPASSGVGTAATAEVVNRNIVRGVQPPGQLWTIRDLDATVKTDGTIRVKGRGLLLAGGDSVGLTPTPPLNVFATLICETATPFTQRNTNLAGVQLAPDGDFEIDDLLSPAPPAPPACTRPVLLIRNTAGNQARFAAGIPDLK